MRVTFLLQNPKVIAALGRLAGGRPAGEFLRDCLAAGLREAARKGQPGGPVPLSRARPEFARLKPEEIAPVLEGQDRAHPVYAELQRLVGLYAPVLRTSAEAIPPRSLLKLDVRAPIEKVAADLAFRALARDGGRPAQPVTVH
jgi:hypothetical protein